MRRDLIVLFDWSLRGFSPLQEARWLAVSKWLMSVPISAINDVAALIFTPGIVCKLCNCVEYSFSQMASILSIHSCLCCSAKSISALSCRMMSMSHSVMLPVSEAIIVSFPWWLIIRPWISSTSTIGVSNSFVRFYLSLPCSSHCPC